MANMIKLIIGDRMREMFEKISKESNLVGASCIVMQDGKIVEELNYGYSSIEKNTLVNSNTVFRIASVSKIIVALGIMKLYEQGKLDLDEDISKYLGFKVRNPKFPDDKITLKLLMTQNSSITDGNELDGGYNSVNGTNKKVSLEDLLSTEGKFFYEKTFDDHKPGTKFIYSNFNCGILACIIEKVSGRLFTNFIREEVLLPLGVDASFRVGDIINPDVATLYSNLTGKIEICRTREDFINMQYEIFPLGDNYRGPAGGLFISMKDLTKVMSIFLNNGNGIFEKETIELMLTKHWEGFAREDSSYRAKGLQIHILDYFDNRTLYGHFGSAYGARSFMLFNPEKNIGICYITNGGGFYEQGNGFCDVHEKMINLFLDKYWR